MLARCRHRADCSDVGLRKIPTQDICGRQIYAAGMGRLQSLTQLVTVSASPGPQARMRTGSSRPSTVDGFAARTGPRWVERRDLKLTRLPARFCLARIGPFRTQAGDTVATPLVDRFGGAGGPARARPPGGDGVRGGRRFGAGRFVARRRQGPM